MAFRFETLLKLRKNTENLRQKDFAAAQGHLLNQQDQLRFMLEVAAKSKRELTQSQPHTDINTMILYDDFFNGVQAQEQLQEQIISEILPKVEAKRQALAEAMRKRRTLEILEERERQAMLKEQMKQETALLDEAASIQWHRKR